MNLLTRLLGKPPAALGPEEARAKLNQKDKPFILDVRQPDEFQVSHIPGARLIPLNELPGRIDELPKQREIICVCRSGNRSASAVRQLSAAGLQAVNLSGGMIAWTRAGYPVKKGRA